MRMSWICFVCVGACMAVGCDDATSDPVIITDANAQDEGQARIVLTADTDASRLESGAVSLKAEPQRLVDGPIVITTLASGAAGQFWIAANCETSGGVRWEVGADMMMSGGRIIVPSGQQLCVAVKSDELYYIGEGLAWGGFRPYE